jgi:hypothetical protein
MPNRPSSARPTRSDRSEHVTGTRDNTRDGVPPRGSSRATENKYAYFAAQLAERSERLRVNSTPPAPPLGRPVEEPADRRSLSRLAVGRPGRLWAGGLLLASVSVAVLIGWGGSDRPAPAPPRPIERPKVEQAKAATSVADVLKSVVPGPVSTPTLPKEFEPPAPPPVSSAALPPAPQPAQSAAAPLTRDETGELQNRLKTAGFDPGPIDGVVGPRTIDAARKYGAARALTNADASKEMLARLRAEPAQAAGLNRR